MGFVEPEFLNRNGIEFRLIEGEEAAGQLRTRL